MATSLHVIPVSGIPLVEAGDDLADLIGKAIRNMGQSLIRHDVLVLAQKIVSKAENRYMRLADVTPGPEACTYAEATGKDPRIVELVLSESSAVLRARFNTLIVAHRLGHVQANAGIDQSNISNPEERVLLLPENPNASARLLRESLQTMFDAEIGVVIADSMGRAWRLGTIGTAIGSAGLPALLDMRGRPDLFGRQLAITETGFADEIAATATLIMGQADEAVPAAIVRGLHWPQSSNDAGVDVLLRPMHLDMFR